MLSATARTPTSPGIMQHVEEAGVHSGDSACVLPPLSLGEEMLEQVRRQTRALALRLGVIGLLNVQFALVENGRLYVIEANPRASRTVPFVSKAIGVPLAKVACRLILGERLRDQDLPTEWPGTHVSVKEAVLPFQRLHGADALLGPEMKSTGEVMGIAEDFPAAFGKAQAAAGVQLPASGSVFISVCDTDKPAATQLAARMHDLGFRVLATRGHGPGDPPDGHPGRGAEQDRRGIAARRRLPRGRPGGSGHQHSGRPRGAHRRMGDPARGDRARDPVHHDHDRGIGGRARDRRRPDGSARCARCRSCTGRTARTDPEPPEPPRRAAVESSAP